MKVFQFKNIQRHKHVYVEFPKTQIIGGVFGKNSLLTRQNEKLLKTSKVKKLAFFFPFLYYWVEIHQALLSQ